jgi:hypothetical protein
MPAQLHVGDLYVNRPLGNVSTAYVQGEDAFIADKVFPMIPSQFMSGQYWKWPKGTYFNTSVEKRAPGAPVPMISWKIDLDSYLCDPYAIGQPIPDMHRANADSIFSLDSIAVRQLTRQHLLNREKAWAATYFTTAVWGEDVTGVASAPTTGQTLQWSSSGSDPINFMQTLKIRKLEETGIEFNTLVMTLYVLQVLLNHPLVLDRIKYVQSATPMSAMSVLPTVLDVPRILIAKAVINSANDVNVSSPGTGATGMHFVFASTSALFCYSPPAPGIEVPASGYTFAWSGMFGADAYGLRVKKYRDERLAADIVESEAAWQQRLVAADLGVFLASVVA